MESADTVPTGEQLMLHSLGGDILCEPLDQLCSKVIKN